MENNKKCKNGSVSFVRIVFTDQLTQQRAWTRRKSSKLETSYLWMSQLPGSVWCLYCLINGSIIMYDKNFFCKFSNPWQSEKCQQYINQSFQNHFILSRINTFQSSFFFFSNSNKISVSLINQIMVRTMPVFFTPHKNGTLWLQSTWATKKNTTF